MIKNEYLLMDKLEESHWWFLAKRSFIQAYFPTKKRYRVLDIGAGTGGTTRFLQRYGKVVGLEKNPLARKLARKKGLHLKKGSAERLPFRNSSFDIVTILDVLYHKNIVSDSKVIEEAYRVLKKNGRLLITDSALELLRSRHDIAVKTRHRYTKGELVKKIGKAGFKIEKASYAYFFVFPLIFAGRMAGKFSKREVSDLKMPPRIINNFLTRLCFLEAKLLNRFNIPIGSSVILRAKKP